ncbi:MAG TPA: site-2 protease family protein [Blastocatellia bacterium]|nr:site-2 protease family protein [Blastocatellia bacterium]
MKGIKLGKLFGIELRLNFSWFVFFLWVTFALGQEFAQQNTAWSPTTVYGIAAVTSILFFGSVLLHELSHSLVAKAYKLPVQSITLHLFGGVSQMDREPARAREELFIAGAGPLMSIVLGIIFGGIYLATKSISVLSTPAGWLAFINIFLAVLNLVPGFPLDGGRILRAALWGFTKDFRRSTKIAARAGQAIAGLLIMIGLFCIMSGNWMGLWYGLIGFYLLGMAKTSYQQVELQYMLRGLKVSNMSLEDLPQISGKLNIADFLNNYILGARNRHYMIVDDNMIRGVVSLNQLNALEEKTKIAKNLEDVMTPINNLKRIDPETEVIQALELMSQLNASQLPVVKNNELLGFIGRDDLLNYIRQRFEFGLQ